MAYAPGVQDRSGELFARGMQSGIQNGMMALQQGLADYKKNKDDADMQDGLHRFIGQQVKDDPKAVEMFGEDLASYPTMGLSKKKALNAGISAYLADKMQKKDQEQKDAMQQAIIQNYKLGQERMNREGVDRDAMLNFFQAYSNPNPIGQGLGPIRPDAMTHAQRAMGALQAAPGAANNPNLDNLLKVVEQQGRGGGKDVMPVAFDVGGRKGIVSKYTGAIYPDVDPEARGKLTEKDKVIANSKRLSDLSRIAGSLMTPQKERETAMAEITRLSEEQHRLLSGGGAAPDGGAERGAPADAEEAQAKAAIQSNPAAEKAIRARYKQRTGKDL